MTKVVHMSQHQRKRVQPMKPLTEREFDQAVNEDIEKLCGNFEGMDAKRAIELATDFYRKYPALMERVRMVELL